MKRSMFMLVVAILAFVFGAMMFFIPSSAAPSLGLEFTPYTSSLLRGMGGLIIGSGATNFLTRNNHDAATSKAVLLTNIVTHAFGLSADVWGILDGALTVAKMVPVEITHLFSGIGSLICLVRLRGGKLAGLSQIS